jgi:hypothetical protein
MFQVLLNEDCNIQLGVGWLKQLKKKIRQWIDSKEFRRDDRDWKSCSKVLGVQTISSTGSSGWLRSALCFQGAFPGV